MSVFSSSQPPCAPRPLEDERSAELTAARLAQHPVARPTHAERAWEALSQGDSSPFLSMMSSWRWSEEPGLREAAARLVTRASADPPPGLLTAQPWCATAGALKERREAWAHPAQGVPQFGSEVWVIRELAAWGSTLAGWRRAGSYPADSEMDPILADAWSKLLLGDPFSVQPTLKKVMFPVLLRQFNALMQHRNVPKQTQRRVREELRESFMFMLIDRSGGVPPGVDIALRILQNADSDGFGLARLLCSEHLGCTASCLAGRRHWGATLRAIWPQERTSTGLAQALRRLLREQPAHLLALTELHIVARLVERWRVGGRAATHPDHAARVIQQNLDFVRARLRAVLADTPAQLLGPLLQLSGLHKRTVEATSRLAWGWARRELPHHFAMGEPKSTRPCERSLVAQDEGLLPIAADDTLRTWALLAILRGQDERLRRWTATGSTGDRDSAWGRLLAEAPDLLKPQGELGPLRATLAEDLPEIMTELEPLLLGLAALPEDRNLKARAESLLRPGWVGAPFPDGGFQKMPERARLHLARRGVTEETR